MKRIFLTLLFTPICLSQVKTVESRVVEATVFKDRAMITRSAEMNLQKGENQIVFSDLTTDINDETVRISTTGSNEIKILDVKVERKYTPEIRKEEIKELQKKIDELKNKMLTATDQIAIYDSKKEFIESLKAEAVKYANQKILMNSNSTKEWNDLLNFIETNLTEVYNGIREESMKRSVIDEEIKALQLTINQSQTVEPKNYKEIIVKIYAPDKSTAEIKAAYIVNSASWYPIYDARVDTKLKRVEFTFFGMIQQSTGEDWNDVQLTFSTADPLSIKTLPKLDPWFLDINPLPFKNNTSLRDGKSDEIQFLAGGYEASFEQNWGLPKGAGAITGYITDKETGEPLIGANVLLEGTNYGSATDATGRYYITNIPVRSYNIRVSYVGYNSTGVNMNVPEKNIVHLNIPLQQADISLNEVVVTDSKVFEEKSTNTVRIVDSEGIKSLKNEVILPKYSDVKAKDLSTTFELNTKNTIPSDNSPHKVTIAMNVLPIEFSYTSIPKILPKVYLKGKVVNKNDYPLLEGQINVFVDNDFVNRTLLNTVVPTDTLEIALGIDESIKCEKILKNRFVESIGLFGGSKRVNYDYEIKVVNNRKTEESILVIDQLPVTRNENIKTELIIPSQKEVEINPDNELVWRLKLSPGETKIIPLKFYVEFPNNKNVYGLE